MSSYIYRDRERDRDWDEPRSSVSIKRYIVPSEDSRDRDYRYRHEYPDRELVVRRSTDRDDRPMMMQRYDRDVDYDSRGYDRGYRSERDYYEREYCQPYGLRRFARSAELLAQPERDTAPIIIREGQPVIIHKARGPIYVNPRESDYDIVHRSEVDRDPVYSQRRLRHYDEDRASRRELSPGDSVSQVSRRRDDQGYSSDDSMVYIRKETRDYDDNSHRRHHLAGGALVGVGAAEYLRGRRKKEGEDVSHGIGRVGQDVGAGALGAVAVNLAERGYDWYRSRSRHRSHSFDDDRSSRHHHRHSRSHRSRSRSSHSRTKHLAELGLGAAAIAGAVALARKKSNKDHRSRSRRRRSDSSTRAETDDDRSQSQRRKHMAGAGLAGATVAGLVDRARSKSRSRKGERSRSRSKFRTALPIVAGGLGTAAAAGLYEKHKDKKEQEGSRHRGRRHSRSRSRPRSEIYPDPTRDSAGLIEYGEHPVHGSIPAADYYGRPVSQEGYYSDAADPVASGTAGFGPSRYRSISRSPSRTRSRSRGGRGSDSSSDSDRGSRRRHRRRDKHRSRSRDLAGAALAASGMGYAAHKYSKRKDRKKDRGDPRYDDHDPYEESYNPEPYAPSPPPVHPADNAYYPNTGHFPPPPGSVPPPPAGHPAPYHPADYPPPPGAVPPPQPYGYPPPGAEPYAPRPRRADENVSATRNSIPPIDEYHMHDGIRTPRPRRRRSRATSQPAQSKSVSFDVSSSNSPRSRRIDRGYETDDDSDSTVGSIRGARRRSYRRRRPSSSRRYRYHSSPHRPDVGHSAHENPRSSPDKKQESDSDSTIDLPDRFDSQGRLLPQREDEHHDSLEGLLRGLNKVFA